MLPLVFKVFYFIIGATVGSFLNVLILRIPAAENFVTQRSHCPKCKKLIYWYENIPILSYLFLRGKCSKCKSKISMQYPLIELVTGLFALTLAYRFDLSSYGLIHTVFFFSLFCCFLVHFVIDIRHHILPDGVNIYIALTILAYSIYYYTYQHWLYGGLVGFMFPLGVTYLFYLLKNQVGLGGGDIKLFGALGLLLGPLNIMYTIFFSCVFGSLVSLPLMLMGVINKNTPVAFGPFIILVASFQIFYPKYFQKLLAFLF